jgi:mono/diheme cytochrome c family protein
MTRPTIAGAGAGTVLLALLSTFALSGLSGQDEQRDPVAGARVGDAIARGEYVYRAAGGCTCHSDPASESFSLAGGRPIKTPFGTIYGTNITPDAETGLGAFSDEDFARAMREGLSPKGDPYYPVFPYTSFTKMSDRDLADLKAYLFSLPPVKKENRPPDFRFPYSNRASVSVWRGLYFRPKRFENKADQSAEWNRGAYISEALAHCGECHTPRTFLGATNGALTYAGSRDGPEGELAPNITPDEKTGIGSWSVADVAWFLQTSFKPDGDDAQGLMGEVIEHGYGHLEEADLKAIAAYLRSLEPIENEVKAK